MLKKILPIITIVSFCATLLLMNLFTPSSAGPFGILAVFLFAYVFLIGISCYILVLASHLIRYVAGLIKTKKPIRVFSVKDASRYALIIALAPMMIVGLQSVGASSAYGVFLIILFISIGCLYVAKTK